MFYGRFGQKAFLGAKYALLASRTARWQYSQLAGLRVPMRESGGGYFPTCQGSNVAPGEAGAMGLFPMDFALKRY